MEYIITAIGFIILGFIVAYLLLKGHIALKEKRITTLEETIIHQGEEILNLQKELSDTRSLNARKADLTEV